MKSVSNQYKDPQSKNVTPHSNRFNTILFQKNLSCNLRLSVPVAGQNVRTKKFGLKAIDSSDQSNTLEYFTKIR